LRMSKGFAVKVATFVTKPPRPTRLPSTIGLASDPDLLWAFNCKRSPTVTGEFHVTEFGLREKKKIELNKEHFIEKLVKKKN
jgi:hypothetical protein